MGKVLPVEVFWGKVCNAVTLARYTRAVLVTEEGWLNDAGWGCVVYGAIITCNAVTGVLGVNGKYANTCEKGDACTVFKFFPSDNPKTALQRYKLLIYYFFFFLIY